MLGAPSTLSNKKLEQEQVKRALRENSMLPLYSRRRNRSWSVASPCATSRHHARHLDSWHLVRVSVLHFSHTAFSAQYDNVLVVCCHLLIGSTRIVWTSEAGVSGGVFLSITDAKWEGKENLRQTVCFSPEGVSQVLMSAVCQLNGVESEKPIFPLS